MTGGRVVRRVLLVVAVGLVLPASALGALGSTPVGGLVVNGSVRALAAACGTVYLGGHFSRVELKSGPGVQVDPTTATPSFVPAQIASGSVFAVRNDGQGGWYVGGQFSSVGGVARSNLAHIRPDGTVDPGFAPSINGTVRAISVIGSTIFIGGAFTSVNGEPRSRLAALTKIGALTSFAPNPTGSVSVLESAGQTLFVGGSFTAIAGSGHPNLAAFDAGSGALLSSFDPAPDRPVLSLAISGTSVYVGGGFTQIGGLDRPYLAELNVSDGSAIAGLTRGLTTGYTRSLWSAQACTWVGTSTGSTT